MRSYVRLGLMATGLLMLAGKVAAGCLEATWTPVQAGVFAPVQVYGEKTVVRGWRLSTVYCDNEKVYGLDTGIFTGATKAGGVQIAAANFCSEQADGVQIALANADYLHMNGVQIAAFNLVGRENRLKTGMARGAQFGWVNVSKADFTGAQTGMANFSENGMFGAQLGFINTCDAETPDVRCFQLGVLNFNKNGFLPFFPIFNF